MPITTDLDRFRLELGDIDPDTALFNDDEAGYFLAKHPTNILLAVADACDALAARFAREFDFDSTSDKSFKRSQKAAMYEQMAARFRERANTEGNSDGTGGGLPLASFPGPHDWMRDLGGLPRSSTLPTEWPL